MILNYCNLAWRGEYFAYGTRSSVGDTLKAGRRMVPALRSRDLATWEYRGGALELPPGHSKGTA